ncbi:MAG: helix-turn-helix domain-containing protein [bacterium]|nr:helix-turn-helix domain-containing protein [bacterium]
MEASPHERALLEQAASEALSSIASSQDQASSPRLKELLRYLEGHLFEQGLNADTWFRACNIRSHRVRASFREQLKTTPHAYFNKLRVGVAKNLLKDTPLEIWRVSQLVGYSRLESFDRVFRRSTGATPTAFRQKNQGTENRAPRRHDETLAPLRDWRRILISAETREFLMEMAEKNLKDYSLFSELLRTDAKADEGLAGVRKLVEQHNAEKVWKKLRGLRFYDQQLLVRLQITFQTTALFDLLREKSLNAGRVNRHRGVQLAELALASLDACTEALGDDLPNRLAQGWTCLGNAYFLATEPARAEQAFARGEFELERAGTYRDPLVEAELDVKKAKMFWYQRRYEEALKLVNQAIPILRRANRRVDYAQGLMVRAFIKRDAGDPGAAIEDFRKALSNINEKDQAYLCLSAQTGIAFAYSLAGEYEEAENALTRAEALCTILGNILASHQVQWTAGLLAQAKGDLATAQQLVQQARSGLIKLGELGYTAVVSLDFAILYSEAGRATEAMEIAVEALPMLEALKLSGEALATFELLRDAVAKKELTITLLKEVRESLAESQGVPPSHDRQDQGRG